LSFSLVLAVAAEGILDYLPPQPYFPAALRRVAVADCDKGGQRWPSFGTSADFRREAGPVIPDFEADWYALHWRAAHERSLYEASTKPETRSTRTLRFTWLRTFHAPVIVRVDEVASGQIRLTAKELDG